MARKKKQQRQRRAFGSITEVIEGEKYICRWPENTDKGRSRPSKTIEGTWNDADFFLAVKRVELGKQKRAPTIGELYELLYIPWLKRQLENGKKKASTVERYIELWDLIVADEWAKTPIDRVRPVKFQNWVLEQKPGNANIALVLLRKIGDLAMNNDYATDNIFRRNYDLPTSYARKKDTSTYSLKKAHEVLKMVEGTNVLAPYILSCFGGTRVGESLGVLCEEVERFESDGVRFAVVPIRRRMGKTGFTPFEDGDLKTQQSLRETLVPEPYCDLLFEIIEHTESAWLADRGDGLPLNANSFMYFFNQAVGKSAIPLSNLRASWRTFCEYSWRIPSDTLELLMGHKLDGVSGKHYIRPTIKDLAHSFAVPYKKNAKDI